MKCVCCKSALDLNSGDECGYCGTIASDNFKIEKREIVRYFYQSQVDCDKDGNGLWKACSEDICMQMHKGNFKVKKIVKEI